MINKINWINRIYQRILPVRKDDSLNLDKLQYAPDSFECKTNKTLRFKIKHIEYMNLQKQTTINVELNPIDKAVIFEKIIDNKTMKVEKVPLEIQVAKSQSGYRRTYHFIDKNKQEIGYVTICDWKKAVPTTLKKENSAYLKDYPAEGIIGDRITIDYLQNNNEIKYSGIGEVADQIAIEYCLKEGIKPNIVSLADTGSLISHYKRGRRFFKITPDNDLTSYDYFTSEYGTNDPNKIIEKKLAETPKGSWAECTDLEQLYMYMPQEVIQKYLNRIKEHPILH